MSSPLSSVVAQLVMEYLKKKVLPERSNGIIFIKIYIIDNNFCVNKDKIEFLMNTFNILIYSFIYYSFNIL